MEWNAAAIIGLQALLDAKLTYTEISKRLGVSRSAIAGAVRRHIQHNYDNRKSARKQKPRATPTHNRMVEPWAAYTARKQKERAEARAATLQVTSTGPRQEAD